MYNLTLLQFAASRFMITTYLNHKNGLIIAVCGAGKTEMTFPLINKQRQTKKIAFAIPRIDIVEEIYKRLTIEFGIDNVGIRYGTQQHNIDANIICLTTNQLAHYKSYFDIIIIDEVDAFPFDNNPEFDSLVSAAQKNISSIFYLTSTPSDFTLSKNFEIFTLYKRWHNFPLPIPTLINRQYKHYAKLARTTTEIITVRPRQLLIFVASVTNGTKLSNLLSKLQIECHFTHSKDLNRAMKIEQFRTKKLDILITTTILERGVTFDDIDVLVYDADHPHYNLAALIQISGRVGRKINYQEGCVYFQYEYYTPLIKQSIKRIKSFNKKI